MIETIYAGLNHSIIERLQQHSTTVRSIVLYGAKSHSIIEIGSQFTVYLDAGCEKCVRSVHSKIVPDSYFPNLM